MSSARAEWQSAEQFQRFLKEARAKGAQTERLMAIIAGELRSSTIRRIEQEHLEQKNASVTKAVKGRDGAPAPPLQDRSQFVPGIAKRSSDEVAAVGSNAPQASILQTGGTIEAQDADKLAFPAEPERKPDNAPHIRALQGKYGHSPEDLVTGMREDGWEVWFLENAVMANKPTTDDKAFPILIRKKAVEIPAYRPFRLTDQNQDDIRGIVRTWIRDVGLSARP